MNKRGRYGKKSLSFRCLYEKGKCVVETTIIGEIHTRPRRRQEINMHITGQAHAAVTNTCGHSKQASFNLNLDSRLEYAAHRIAFAVAQLGGSSVVDDSSPRAYIVGGWTRDKLLGRSSSDIDIEVHNLNRREIVSLIKALFPGELLVESKDDAGPLKLIFGKAGFIDISLAPSLPGISDVPGVQTLELLRRCTVKRDFTCNSIYFDPVTQQMLDPSGGIEDLKNRVLRLNSQYLDAPLQERTPLRASRLEAQLGVELDEVSLDRISKLISTANVTTLALKTNGPEIRKLLCNPERPSIAIRSALKTGLLDKLFPSLVPLRGVPQDSRYHPEGDVFEHTLLALDEAAIISKELDEGERFKVLLGVLYHDTGKANTTSFKHGKNGLQITAFGHERESEALAWRELRDLGLSRDVCVHVCRMVKHHMRPLGLANGTKFSSSTLKLDNQVRQLVRDVHPASFDSFLTLCKADQLGRGAADPVARIRSILSPLEDSYHRNNFRQTAGDRLLKGADLETLGFSSGHVSYQTVLSSVEKLRDDGKLTSADEARRYVLRHYSLNAQQLADAGITTGDAKREFFKAFSDAIKTATVWSVKDSREMMRSYSARMQQKKAGDSDSVDFRGADIAAQEPSEHVVAKSPAEWFSTAMIGMPSTPPMPAADLQKLGASHGIIRVAEGDNATFERSRIIQPDMPQSGKMEILKDDLMPGSGLSFAGQWSYNVTFAPKDTLERMKNEFSWLRKQLPILAGIKVDLSGVAFACVREAEAKALRQAVRSERLRNSKIRPDYLEQLIVEPFNDVEAFYSVDNKTVYVVHEAVDREAEWETKSILAHELTHALQVHAFPDFHKSIGNLLSRGIDQFNESQENRLFKLQHINKSIGARLDWLERHACYFGDCAYEYLLDDERDFTGIVRYAVNERLFQLEKFHREPSKLEAEEIVASMFTIPELADLLFRDDGVVCIDERQQKSHVIRKRVSEFARKFLNQEEVRFFPLG